MIQNSSLSGVKPPSPVRIFASFEDATKIKHPICPMLGPFLGGGIEDDPRDPDWGRHLAYGRIARELFVLTSRDQAQVAVLPWEWRFVADNPALHRMTRQYIRSNAKAGLRTLVFSGDDSEKAVCELQTINFRASILQRNRKANEYAWPAYCSDYLIKSERTALPIRPFTARPVVGFCGASYRQSFKRPNWFRRHFRPDRCQYERVHPRGQGLRARVLDQLNHSPGIQTSIIERTHFQGGALAGGGKNYDLFQSLRREYLENLLDCDYALCLRGAGNFSYRFYEALSLGRIPLFVNTDCALPWENLIPWRELCLWVEYDEIDRIGDAVAEQHRQMTPETFVSRQRRCREIWEKHLSLAGFFQTLQKWLPTILPPQA